MNEKHFSAPYIYTNLYKDEMKREEVERGVFREEVKASDDARAREILRESLNVRIFHRACILDAVQCLTCGQHFVLFKNLCVHLQGKMETICEAYGVYYDK